MATLTIYRSLIPPHVQSFALILCFLMSQGMGYTGFSEGVASPVTTPTVADDKDEEKRREVLNIARTEYKRGLKDFKAERYREALQRFVRVYRLKPHPNLVYNMARSFEQLKEYQSAAEYYQKYLEIHPNAEDRPEVEITIRTMEKLSQDRQPQKDAYRREQELMRRIGWGGVALGSAFIIGGSLFGMRALNQTEDLRGYSAGDSLQSFNSTYDQRNQASLFADLFMVGGVAMTSLGLYFALRPQPPQKLEQRSSVSLSVSSNTLFIQGAF